MPALSRYGVHVYHTYLKVARTRQSSGFGLNAITEQQIRGFERRYRVRLSIVFVEHLFAIDAVFRKASSDQHQPEGDGSPRGRALPRAAEEELPGAP